MVRGMVGHIEEECHFSRVTLYERHGISNRGFLFRYVYSSYFYNSRHRLIHISFLTSWIVWNPVLTQLIVGTIDSRYIAAIYNTIIQQLQWYHFGPTVHSRTTSHISPSPASYGVCFVKSSKKYYRDISRAHYIEILVKAWRCCHRDHQMGKKKHF